MKRKLGLILAAMPIMASPALVHAQVANAADPSPTQTPDTSGEIIVTARLRAEPLQQTPLAVTAITAVEIANSHVQTFVELGNRLPNVQLGTIGQQGRASNMSIRGINYGNADQTGDPSNAFYLDGLYLTRATVNVQDIYDVQQLEVLRGPQNILMGRNAFGGAITIRSKRPTFDGLGGDVEAEVGNYGRRSLRANVNVPIIDDVLALRVASLFNKSDGFYRNVLDGNRRFGGDDTVNFRLGVMLKPTSNLSFYAKYERERNNGDPTPDLNASTPDMYFGQQATNPPNYPTSNPFSIKFNWPLGQKSFVHKDTGLLEGKLRFAGGEITSLTGYQDEKDGMITSTIGGTPNLNQYFQTQASAFSQELRINYELASWISVIAGGYYQTDKIHIGQIVTGVFGNTQNEVKQKRDSEAVFAEVELRPLEKVRINVGGREMWEKKTFSIYPTAARPAGSDFTTILPGLGTYGTSSANWQNFSPRVSVDYRPSSNLMVYATWSKGFKSGGYAALAANIAGAGPYNPEKVTSYEVGFKSTLFDRKLRFNVALFRNELAGLQRRITVQLGGVSANSIINAAGAITQGFEAELNFNPTKTWNIWANTGYLSSHYSSFCAAFGQAPGRPLCAGASPLAVDNTNLDLTNAPKWQIGGGTDYTLLMGEHGTIGFGVEGHYTSSLFTNDSNAALSKRAKMTTVDMNARWSPVSDRFWVTLYVRNLFNVIRTGQGTVAAPTLALWNPTPPRTMGGTVGFKF
jgi:iron complex outermembrane receptor protein